jgi:host factor-I protein
MQQNSACKAHPSLACRPPVSDVHPTCCVGETRPGTPHCVAAKNKKDRAVAAEKSQNVQDVFLNHVRKSKTPVTIFLVNGVKLQGIITWFDNFSVLLRRDGHTQLVYKHAISTVMPGAPIQLFDPNAPREGATVNREGTTLTMNREVNPVGSN